MPVKRSIFVVLLSLLPHMAAAQEASLQGIVTSAESGVPLEGVAIALETGGRAAYSAFTDRNGFFLIGGITPGSYTLTGRQLGYLPHEQAVAIAAGERVRASFRLQPVPVVLQGIIVATERGAAVREMGRQVVTPADIRLVPVPAGSGDLAAYIQTLPGVTTTGDRGGQVFVRGGTPSENLVLVDGIPIYQPFHILGFFSVFPEDLVSTVDFYAGGFGARYSGRTSSVLDVRMREGDRNGYRMMASASPFLAEALIEGPWQGAGLTWLASVRRSLVEETSRALIGSKQPMTFDSQLLKVASTSRGDDRCSALLLRTSDRGSIDPEDEESHVGWRNLIGGLRCIKVGRAQLLEVNFSYSRSSSDAVSRGASDLSSVVWRAQHDIHATTMLAGIPLHAGYHAYLEQMDYDLTELFGDQSSDDAVFGASAYVEASVGSGRSLEVRPGVVLAGFPRPAIEPRVRASWQPFGRASEVVQGSFGLYRQSTVGTSDMRDVANVFTAWMSAPDGVPLRATHASLGWQQTLGGGVNWSLEGYYKRMRDIPVARWRAVAQFTTDLGRAHGESYGGDVRLEYARPRFHGFIGYGYSWTRYETSQWQFNTWFGEPVQYYHPSHDRRHQLNAVVNTELAGFRASARWQLGTGLPFTRPLGFDEAFDYTQGLHDPHTTVGTTRLVLDRPFNGRLPMTHRLDVSIERAFEIRAGELVAQAGVVNAYDRRNMFYYDLYTGRRADQLPLAPFASLTLRAR
jgi:hypothetical protein